MPKTFFVSRRKKLFSALAVLFLSITQALAQPAYAAGYSSREYPSTQSLRDYFDWGSYWDKLLNMFTPTPSPTPTPAPTLSTAKDFYRVDGTQIVNASGAPVQLKGIGMGNNVWYTQNRLPTTDHDEESFAELEQLGFNSVRFYLNASLFESDNTPYTYSEDAFQWLDDNIHWAKKHNIRLLLNMHIPQGGKISATNTAFWDNSEYQKRFIALWTEIARRYAEEETVLGYGLLNEPFIRECSSPDAALNLYYDLMEQTATAIRAVDTNHILFLERPYGTVNSVKKTTDYVWGTTESFRLIPDSNTVYEFHFYDRTEFTHQGLSWLSYSDRWTYNNDTVALLSGARQLGKICKTAPTALDVSSSDWQHIETIPISITNPNANYGYWIIYINNIGQNAKTYIDNLVIKEYDQNGTYLRDLRTFDFDTTTPCAGWDLGSGGGGRYSYGASNGTNNSGCAVISDVLASYRFYRNYTANMNFPLNPEHTYAFCADIRLENVTDEFSLELGVQTASCNNVYSFNKEYLRACLQPFLSFGTQNNVPLYLGEFGVTRHIMNSEYQGDAWVADTFDLLNEYNLSYSYHDYHEENFGLYINDSRNMRGPMNPTLYQLFVEKLP